MRAAPKEKKIESEDGCADAIQQAIYGIMTAKKSVMLGELTREIVEQLKPDFEVGEERVAREVEKCVEEEFVKRHDSHFNTRIYLE